MEQEKLKLDKIKLLARNERKNVRNEKNYN